MNNRLSDNGGGLSNQRDWNSSWNSDWDGTWDGIRLRDWDGNRGRLGDEVVHLRAISRLSDRSVEGLSRLGDDGRLRHDGGVSHWRVDCWNGRGGGDQSGEDMTNFIVL